MRKPRKELPPNAPLLDRFQVTDKSKDGELLIHSASERKRLRKCAECGEDPKVKARPSGSEGLSDEALKECEWKIYRCEGSGERGGDFRTCRTLARAMALCGDDEFYEYTSGKGSSRVCVSKRADEALQWVSKNVRLRSNPTPPCHPAMVPTLLPSKLAQGHL